MFRMLLKNWKVLIVIGLLLIVVLWSFVLIPSFTQSEWFLGLNPVEQYVIINFGVSMLIIVGFGAFITWMLYKRTPIVPVLINGFASFLILTFVYDMWQTPFGVGMNGENLLADASPSSLVYGDIDLALWYVWTNIFGLSGEIVYWLTYLVVPIIAIIMAIFLFGLNRMIGVFKI